MGEINNPMTKNYFSKEELQCKGEDNLYMLAPGFLDKLNLLRETFGKPLIVNSCCRSFSHNEKIGGHPRSFHVATNPHNTGGTCAIDIARHNLSLLEQEKLIFLAAASCWSVGLGSTFIHLDRRIDYTNFPQVCFGY